MATPKKSNGVVATVDIARETTSQAARDARLQFDSPYRAIVKIRGVAMMLMHRYDPASVEAKANEGKGTKGKKTDNVESYVARDEDGYICMPAVNVKACLRTAGAAFQDPRSKRKSAKDLLRAAVFVEPELARINDGVKDWDFLDSRGACVNMSRITRVRPGFREGWTLDIEVRVGQPSLVPPEMLERVIRYAGDFCGLGDNRPDYGRFTIASIEFSTLA